MPHFLPENHRDNFHILRAQVRGNFFGPRSSKQVAGDRGAIVVQGRMPVARPEPNDTRVIAHLDLDCFYVQVEQRRQPELLGKPTAVVQYNNWKGGGLIAVGYEARRHGVKRNMRGDEARKLCPDINLVQVPVAHEKADLAIYRDAGSEVVEVLSRMGRCERTSIDEVYLDLTESAASRLMKDVSEFRPFCVSEEALRSHIVGLDESEQGDRRERVREWFCQTDSSYNDKLLAYGAMIVAELRMAVLAETQFTCSAGIAHNKMLAKLTSGLHKPAQQTIVPSSAVSGFLQPLPITKIGQLGGKLGQSLETTLGVKTCGDLLKFSESKLQELYGANSGTWLWRIVRGISGDEVQERTLPKSHASGKTFPGPKALKQLGEIEHWLGELAAVLQERIDSDLKENNRTARTLSLHASCHVIGYPTGHKKFPIKSCTLRYGVSKIVADALRLFERGLTEFLPASNVLSPEKGHRVRTLGWAVTGMSISASNIVTTPSGVNPITQFLSAAKESRPQSLPRHSEDDLDKCDAGAGLNCTPKFGPLGTTPTDGCTQGFRAALGDAGCSSKDADNGSLITGSCDDKAPQSSAILCSPLEHQEPRVGNSEDVLSSSVHYQEPRDTNSVNQMNLNSVGQSRSGWSPRTLEEEVMGCSNPPEFAGFQDRSPEKITDKSQRSPTPRSPRGRLEAWWQLSSSQHLEQGKSGSNTAQCFLQGKGAPGPDNIADIPQRAPSPRSSRGKLEALWQRSSSQSSQKIRTEQGSLPVYRQEEISEEVMSELPPDIQRELRLSLGLTIGRKQSSKKGTTIITDFFQRSSPK